MKIAMMQPTFLPWQGYFALIDSADIFIILDDFQYSAQSYHQRNRLFINSNIAGWYTIPVIKSFKSQLNETKILDDGSWRRKMWARIQNNYQKTQYYDTYKDWIKEWLINDSINNSLSEFNTKFILKTCKLLGINTIFRYSSNYPIKKHKSEHLLELIRANNCNEYLSAKGSFPYMYSEGIFPISDVKVSFLNYQLIKYKQYQSNEVFVPSLSILDALFNIGSCETYNLIRKGTRWNTWDEMVAINEGI